MRRMLSLSALLSLLGGAQALAGSNIEVMTQNQYFGADLMPLGTATTRAEFNAALVAILQQIAASNFPDRAQRQAAQIARQRPHLVGLQEVWLLECDDASASDGQGCEDPSIVGAFNAQLDETLRALDALGAHYVEVARVTNLDLPVLPFFLGASASLAVTDRDVILARSDVDAAPLTTSLCPGFESDEGCNYQVVLQVPTPVGDVDFERGFVTVDATVHGKDYRFVNTHLEVRQPDPTNPASRFFQSAQAAELIGTLAATTPADRSLIVVGDINSAPEDQPIPGPLPLPPPFNAGLVPPYQQFAAAGYTDAWEAMPGNRPGLTCCQDADLSNRRSLLYERIDMIFSWDEPARVVARLVGDKVSDKTFPPGLGLWPSDHAGVWASLQFQRWTGPQVSWNR
jgi:endonuclease/exonuclease/phosphatase family metal-dependent hydrolase